jgi:hypothetical protein
MRSDIERPMRLTLRSTGRAGKCRDLASGDGRTPVNLIVRRRN